MIELYNNNGNLVNSLIVNIPETNDSGYTLELNWEITPGSNYILTTNFDMNNDNFGDNNPMLRRTTDDLPNFPYIIDNVLEITDGMYDNGDGPGFSTSYYYYFYDWKINNDWGIGGTVCLSEAIEVNILVNEDILGCTDSTACNYNDAAGSDDGSCEYPVEFYDCNGVCINDADNDTWCDELDNCPETNNPNQEDFNDDGIGDACDGLAIDETSNSLFTMFPNPANDILKIKFHNTFEQTEILLFNNVGKLIYNIHSGSISNNQILTVNTDELSPGIYVIHCKDNYTTIKKTFTVSR